MNNKVNTKPAEPQQEAAEESWDEITEEIYTVIFDEKAERLKKVIGRLWRTSLEDLIDASEAIRKGLKAQHEEDTEQIRQLTAENERLRQQLKMYERKRKQ